MLKEEHVFIKSYLTFRGRSKTTRNKLYYVVFGKYTSNSFQAGRHFVRMFRSSDEKSLHESMTFKKNEFCGLEVGSAKKTTRRISFGKKIFPWWKIWEKERYQTFIRLFFTAKDTVEFFIDNEDSNPLQAFRTIEAWRKKLTKELGYRCYWNVYMRPCGQEWGEGYGKLHLTEKSLAIVSTEKRPQTLGHWFLKSAKRCKYIGTKRLIISFQELDEPLVFETDDAQEIARTLAMNMTSLVNTPVYDPFPRQDEPPISKHRKSVSNRHKPVIDSSDDEDNVDGTIMPDSKSESGGLTPNTPVPPSPTVSSPTRTEGSDLVSLNQLEKCEKAAKRQNSPPAIVSTPSFSNNEYPPDYEEAARALPYVGNERTKPKLAQNGIRLQPRPNHPALEKLLISPHPEPPTGPGPERSPKPIPSPRAFRPPRNFDNTNKTPPERPPKSPMLQRPGHTPQATPRDPPTFNDRLLDHGHPQEPPPPPIAKRRPEQLVPNGRRPDEQPYTLPRLGGNRHIQPLMAESSPRGKRPFPAPRQPRAALSRVKSKSMDCLATSANIWDDDDPGTDDINQELMGGGGLVGIDRGRISRKTLKKKQATWKRPVSSYSDDDIKDDREEIYDVSNILKHLCNRRDDRSFRQSTMWYVNFFSAFDKPPPLASYDPDTPPPAFGIDTPPPLPPRDEPSSPGHRIVPQFASDEYWSALIICRTLKSVLHKDPPLPDTLKLSVNLRNKVCLLLYMNNLGSQDWRDLAGIIGLEFQAVELIEAFVPHHNNETSAEIVLRHWQFCYNKYPYDREKCPRACERSELVKILTEMQRHDIVKVIKDNQART